jgi:hypothetical protein
MDSVFPDFPQLNTIKFWRVRCSNLLGLLKMCAATLEVLWLRAVTTDAAVRYLPPAKDGSGVKDLPEPLECVPA